MQLILILLGVMSGFMGHAKDGPNCLDFVPVPFEDGYICVSPDYYEIDGIRTPMTLQEARTVAKENNATLPTPDMVDAIWRAADLKLDPIPMPPTREMTSRAYYIRHDAMIDAQIGDREFTLVAGHKKDIVRPRYSNDSRLTIYGWHRRNGRPIQPVSRVHSWDYYDYSHGVRLVRMPE